MTTFTTQSGSRYLLDLDEGTRPGRPSERRRPIGAHVDVDRLAALEAAIVDWTEALRESLNDQLGLLLEPFELPPSTITKEGPRCS